MKEWKGTKGECEAKFVQTNKHIYVRAYITTSDSFIPTVIYSHRLNDDQCLNEECGCLQEELSNADLVADAFNTMNKCGIMPSELLKQRNELLEALETIIVRSGEHAIIRFAVKTKQKISKCTGK